VDAYANLGNVYKDSGQLQLARDTYTAALNLNPEQAIVWGNLAAVFLELGEINKALQLFDKTLEMQPNFPDALSNRGNALKFAGRLEESIQSYRQALELQPSHTDALNNLVSFTLSLGKALSASVQRPWCISNQALIVSKLVLVNTSLSLMHRQTRTKMLGMLSPLNRCIGRRSHCAQGSLGPIQTWATCSKNSIVC
jgi:tetratricopeptide (TPR) repeat protein